jgi:putative DNA primase/helicase
MDRSRVDPGSGKRAPGGRPSSGGALPAFDLEGWLGTAEQSFKKAPAESNGKDDPEGSRDENPVARPSKTSRPPESRRIERARAYLAKVPPAVAGQRGHDRTFHAACILVQGFGLSVDESRPILAEWNLGCVPPWSDSELDHKLQDAARTETDRPRGFLVGEGLRPGSGSVNRAKPTASTPRDRASVSPEPGCPSGQEANPHRLARLFLSGGFVVRGEPTIRYWHEEFHLWDGSAYHSIPTSEIRAWLTRSIAEEFARLYRLALEESRSNPDRSRAKSVRPIPVTGRLVSDVMQALASLVLVGTRDVPAQPAWLPPSTGPAFESGAPGACPRWPPHEILPARNLLVHLPSLMTSAVASVVPTPRFFNAFALDYDFDQNASEPKNWLSFLGQIWGNDVESITSLQEWFGYLLTPDTRQQKILMMVGPKRSGRGTIARVLKALAGPGSVVNPTLATLARPFGLSSLIGKPIAVFPDARLSSRPDNAAIVECLLSISGEDDQTIDRKHLPAWTGKLPTRFVLISNELPRLRDASGALAGRLIILRFTQSFFGQEDTDLFERLRPELPGILQWAIAGWLRLNERGRFVQPRSARELVATMDDLASPIAAFLRERCVIESEATVAVGLLYDAWRGWCQEHGRDAVGDEHSFGRDLHAAIPSLATTRPRTPTGRVRLYRGIRLRSPADPDSENW